MKKLLKVSFVAMLVAAPFAANADIAAASTVTATAAADVASTSYVKGAYNAAIGEINTNRTQINANTTAIAGKQAQLTNGSTNIGATVKTTVGATGDDVSLVTEKAVRDAITSSNSAMDTRVQALETTVGNASSGLVKGVADNTSAIATINTTLSGYGDVVTHNAADFATASQGSKADQAATDIATINTTLSGYGDVVTHNAADFDAAGTAAGLAGDLNTLSTTQKGSLVAAINEVAGTAGAAKRVTVHTTWNDDTVTAPANVIVNAQ